MHWGGVCKEQIEQIVDIIADMKGHALDSYLIIIYTLWYCYYQYLCCKKFNLHSRSYIVAFSYSVIYQHTKDKPKIKTTRAGQKLNKTQLKDCMFVITMCT